MLSEKQDAVKGTANFCVLFSEKIVSDVKMWKCLASQPNSVGNKEKRAGEMSPDTRTKGALNIGKRGAFKTSREALFHVMHGHCPATLWSSLPQEVT